jgi:hypothetical protein
VSNATARKVFAEKREQNGSMTTSYQMNFTDESMKKLERLSDKYGIDVERLLHLMLNTGADTID